MSIIASILTFIVGSILVYWIIRYLNMKINQYPIQYKRKLSQRAVEELNRKANTTYRFYHRWISILRLRLLGFALWWNEYTQNKKS